MTPDEHAAAAVRLLAELNEQVTGQQTDALRALAHAVLSLRTPTVEFGVEEAVSPAAPALLYVDRDCDVWAEGDDGVWMLDRQVCGWENPYPGVGAVERQFGPLTPVRWPGATS